MATNFARLFEDMYADKRVSHSGLGIILTMFVINKTEDIVPTDLVDERMSFAAMSNNLKRLEELGYLDYKAKKINGKLMKRKYSISDRYNLETDK